MQDGSERGLLEELEAAASRASDHYARHAELADYFGLTKSVSIFADSVEGEKEVLTRKPEEGTYQVAVRWDYQTVGQQRICKEAGFWVVSCGTEAVPQFILPGTQYGRSHYPSQKYRGWLAARPDAILAVWSTRTSCILAFKSMDYDENQIKARFQDAAFVRAKDNLASLTRRSQDVVRIQLAISFRHSRFIRNPIHGLWYPPPRQRARSADYASVTVPDFKVYNAQFHVYLDWLERSIQLDNADFVETVRALGLDTGVLYETQVVSSVRDGLTGDHQVLAGRNKEIISATDDDDDLERPLLKQTISPDEEVKRREDEFQAIRTAEEERTIAEEEERIRQEEEGGAWFEEEEEWYREPGHEHCHYDEGDWVTQDGDPCPHTPDG